MFGAIHRRPWSQIPAAVTGGVAPWVGLSVDWWRFDMAHCPALRQATRGLSLLIHAFLTQQLQAQKHTSSPPMAMVARPRCHHLVTVKATRS